MSAVGHKRELFESIVRLRRAGRELPHNRDIYAVRAMLEGQLGETVSRRLAARILGVSHTALDRWIRSGDIPVVYSTSGRLEVPVPALLDLRDSLESGRANSTRRVLAPEIARRRQAAERLRLPELDATGEQDPHGRARARSLAYHRAVADRLTPAMVDEARYVLFRWREQDRIDRRYSDRWERLLDKPIEELRRALVDEAPDSDDLRQNSPFAGLLSEPERNRIMREVV